MFPHNLIFGRSLLSVLLGVDLIRGKNMPEHVDKTSFYLMSSYDAGDKNDDGADKRHRMKHKTGTHTLLRERRLVEDLGYSWVRVIVAVVIIVLVIIVVNVVDTVIIVTIVVIIVFIVVVTVIIVIIIIVVIINIVIGGGGDGGGGGCGSGGSGD